MRPAETAAWARRLCDRHEGIGGDGVLLYTLGAGHACACASSTPTAATARSPATACAAWPPSRPDARGALRRSTWCARRVGPRTVAVPSLGRRPLPRRTDLGPAILDSDEIPVALQPRAAARGRPSAGGRRAGTVRVTATSLGNPHCAVFLDAPADDALLATLGPALERHAFFPRRTNVEFVTVEARDRIRVRFWERGVGYTRASGTGAASAVVAAVVNGPHRPPGHASSATAERSRWSGRRAATSGRWARWRSSSRAGGSGPSPWSGHDRRRASPGVPAQLAGGSAELKKLGDRALERMDEVDLQFTPDPESNSPAVIVQHVAGNMISRWTDFLTTDGEKPDRNRDGEFVLAEIPTRSSCARAGRRAGSVCSTRWGRSRPADLDRTVTIRGETLSVMDAIHRQLTHYGQHVGQIVYIAKHRKWRTWESLSMPRKR